MMIAFGKTVQIRTFPRQTGWYYGLLILICVMAIGWAFYSPRFYAWVLGNELVTIVVFCDTSELNDPNLKAVVLYDELALTPLTKALGLYQNRPPEQVKVCFPVPVQEIELTPISITLKNVKFGPIACIVFIARGKHFHVNVPDRRIFNRTLYVRVPS